MPRSVSALPSAKATALVITSAISRPLTGSYPYVYVDGVYLKRSWGGEIQNVSILVAIGVSNDGCREIIGDKKLQDGIEETLTYMDFSTQHWTRIRTNNTIERLNREIKRRTKAIGAFPDGQSALMLVCARLRHVAGTQWGTRRYMNMDHLTKMEDDLLSDIIAG